MTRYALPDGSMTTSSTKYVKAWREMTSKLKDHYGVETIGFDPGFLVKPQGQPMCKAVDVPMWLAKRMIDVAESCPIPH